MSLMKVSSSTSNEQANGRMRRSSSSSSITTIQTLESQNVERSAQNFIQAHLEPPPSYQELMFNRPSKEASGMKDKNSLRNDRAFENSSGGICR